MRTFTLRGRSPRCKPYSAASKHSHFRCCVVLIASLLHAPIAESGSLGSPWALYIGPHQRTPRRALQGKDSISEEMRKAAFWDYTPKCSSPALPKVDQPGHTEVPAHGTAVITMTHEFNSPQQHTFHRYYSQVVGAENIFVGIHMHGNCKWTEECDLQAVLDEFSFTPMMGKMFSRGSKLVAGGCAHGNESGKTQAQFFNWLAAKLRALGYTTIVAVEDDEFLVPDPDKYPGGLLEYVGKIGEEGGKPWRRAHGMNVREADGEPKLDRSKPILHQRHYWKNSDPWYCKTAITRVAGRYESVHDWTPSDATLRARYGEPGLGRKPVEHPDNCPGRADPALVLLHLKCVDREAFLHQTFREFSKEARSKDPKMRFTSLDQLEFKVYWNSVWNINSQECGSRNELTHWGFNDTVVKIPEKWIEHANV